MSFASVLLLNFFCLWSGFRDRHILEESTKSDNVFIEFARVDHSFVILAIDMIPVVLKALVTELAILVIGGLVLNILN